MNESKRTAMCLCVALLGCSHGRGNDGDPQSSFGPASTDGDEDGSGGADEDSGSIPGDEDDDDSSGPPGDESSGDDTPAVRCDQVDILFVIEAPEQPPIPTEDPTEDCWWWKGTPEWDAWWQAANEYGSHYGKLQEGFATLVSELYVTLQVPDFQVLVTGSLVPNPTFWNSQLDTVGECVPGAVEVDACDETLGAGRNGYRLAPEADPHNAYPGECMTERFVPSGTMDLPTTFSCLAYENLYWEDYYYYGGYAGDGPDQLMDAMTAAVGSTADAASCNAGFLRDEALLVVVLLEVGADDLADTSSGDAAAWKDALVAAKGGAEERVVVLSLSPDGADPHPLCLPETASLFTGEVRTFTESFTHGLWGSSCLLDYPTFFRAGAQIIDEACDADPGAPG